MRAPIKYAEKAAVAAAHALWAALSAANRVRPRPSFTAPWTDLPLLKSYERTKPPLGWPRETDSLCPACVREARAAILAGHLDHRVLVTEKVGEIKATILERDGRILMVKECPQHGRFEDVLAMDPAFFKHLEDVFPGRDIRAHNDERLHDHGRSTIEYGRGSVLTVDLTNRCNMMCEPCFMDANQVGFVHELTWDEIRTLLDNAVTIKPRRQMSVQFSGGEPTMSPYFLDAIRYARQVGYRVIQAATNGIEFAKSPDFARAAGEAGLRYAYLQFDGIGNAANAHRLVGNLFDVKLRAIENLWAAGVSIVPVVTVVNGVNNEQVGQLVRFALDNPGRIALLSFQPVSFTGRDEQITPERRAAQRYTLSHLAHDVKNQTGIGEPARDWFPISFMSHFTGWADLVRGPEAQWGNLTCGCHPNCGTGMAIMLDKHTREAVPVSAFLNAERLASDVAAVTDAGRGRWLSIAGLALAVLRNYDPFKAPKHLTVVALIRKFARKLAGRVDPSVTREMQVARRRADRWNFLFIAGMWFQDLLNYDFRRTEMCIIPHATQEGEISFCTYNTGVAWRHIVEKMHVTATLTEWYDEHGRHQIYAGGKNVDLSTTDHTLVLDPVAVAAGKQTDLDGLGIAKTAREEKLRARKRDVIGATSLSGKADERMAALYRQHVLKEPAPEPLIKIAGLGGRKKGVR